MKLQHGLGAFETIQPENGSGLFYSSQTRWNSDKITRSAVSELDW